MSTEVFNGNARGLEEFGEVRTLRKMTPVLGVELTVNVEVETAEGVKYDGTPGMWLLQAEDGRRWVCDADYVAANYEDISAPAPVDLGPVPDGFDADAAAARLAEAQDAGLISDTLGDPPNRPSGITTSSTLGGGQ